MSSRKRYLALLVAALPSLLALTAAPPGADAKPKHAKKGVPVKVMTRNIFIGSRLDPVLNSQSFPEFTAANGQILHEVELLSMQSSGLVWTTAFRPKRHYRQMQWVAR